jgi:outer membrane lipoprotein SlyB
VLLHWATDTEEICHEEGRIDHPRSDDRHAVSVAHPAMARQHHNTYHGHNGRYHYCCKRSKGTTGLIAGGAGGALVGSALGGGTLGTVAGGVGGALLGRHLDKRHDAARNRRNGC